MPLFHATAFLLLSINSVTTIYRARRDPSTTTFVICTDLNLILLLWCLKALERKSGAVSSSSSGREKLLLKVLVWLLSTSLNFTFAYRISRMMAFPMAAALCSVAVVTSLSIFYGLFAHSSRGMHRYGGDGYNDDNDDGGGSGGRRKTKQKHIPTT